MQAAYWPVVASTPCAALSPGRCAYLGVTYPGWGITYPGQRVPTLAGGYLPWLGGTQGRYPYQLKGRYLPVSWKVGSTLARVGTPHWLKCRYPQPGKVHSVGWKVGTPPPPPAKVCIIPCQLEVGTLPLVAGTMPLVFTQKNILMVIIFPQESLLYQCWVFVKTATGQWGRGGYLPSSWQGMVHSLAEGPPKC